MTVAELRINVYRGMEWLDAAHPGWWERIDLGRLHLDCCRECMLGQIDGTFFHEYRRLEENGVDDPTAHLASMGFTFLEDNLETRERTDENYDRLWTILTHLWRYQVIRRRELAAVERRNAVADAGKTVAAS